MREVGHRALGTDHGGSFLRRQNRWWDGCKGGGGHHRRPRHTNPEPLPQDLGTRGPPATPPASTSSSPRTTRPSRSWAGDRRREAFDSGLYEGLAGGFAVLGLPEGQKFLQCVGEERCNTRRGIRELDAQSSQAARRLNEQALWVLACSTTRGRAPSGRGCLPRAHEAGAQSQAGTLVPLAAGTRSVAWARGEGAGLRRAPAPPGGLRRRIADQRSAPSQRR